MNSSKFNDDPYLMKFSAQVLPYLIVGAIIMWIVDIVKNTLMAIKNFFVALFDKIMAAGITPEAVFVALLIGCVTMGVLGVFGKPKSHP